MATQPYIYDPSQNIGAEFDKASQGIEKGFALSAQRKMQGYEYVKKQLEDIAEIQQGLQAENEEYITNYAQEQLKATQDAIIANGGDIDYKKLGEIQKQVQEISRAKQRSEMSIKAAEEYTKLIEHNAADINDPQGTQQKINAVLSDERYLFAPKDALTEIQKIYADSINMDMRLSKRMFSVGTKPASFERLNPDGSKTIIEGNLPTGLIIGKNGQVEFENPEEFKQLMRSGGILPKEEMDAWYNQKIKGTNIWGIENRAEDMFMEQYLLLGQSGLKTDKLKSADEVAKEKAEKLSAEQKARIAEFEADNWKANNDAQLANISSQIAARGITSRVALINAKTSARRADVTEANQKLAYYLAGVTKGKNGEIVLAPQSKRMDRIDLLEKSFDLKVKALMSGAGFEFMAPEAKNAAIEKLMKETFGEEIDFKLEDVDVEKLINEDDGAGGLEKKLIPGFSED